MSTTAPVVLTAATVEDTEAIGRRVGTLAQPGDVIALTGDLGAGKTAFVRGLADGLGVPTHMVASPTFTMVAEYDGRLPVYHIDLYRLDPGAADIPALREYLYGPGVTAIEWCDRLPADALETCLAVRIEYAEPGRRLTFEGLGSRARILVAALTPGT
ncbi:MAG: tRNA (adenosine(37)-N6)-threonylcarbamoyltransferase complex ATPase subunit type 1 TsaE [Candidatus Binatia bacterium]